MAEAALVLANYEKQAVRELAAELEPWLQERVKRLRVEHDIRAFTAERVQQSPERRAEERPDLIVVLGGDGALLGAVRAFADDPVPTLGINFGRVGFLASTPASRWRTTLESALEGRCDVEGRMRLQARWTDEGGQVRESVALNEVVLQRGSHQGMLRTTLSVDGVWVTNYRSDGVIVATPSGSTAYSLSAGGPILAPMVEGLVVTPLSSQGLSNRPIVLHADGELELRVVGSSGLTTLAVDGQAYFGLHQGRNVRLTRHPVDYPLLAMTDLDPYRRLRNRLGWGVDPGPSDRS